MKLYVKSQEDIFCAKLQDMRNKLENMLENSGCTNIHEITTKYRDGTLVYNFITPSGNNCTKRFVLDFDRNVRNKKTSGYFMLSSDMYVGEDNHVYSKDGEDLGLAYYKQSVSHDVSERDYRNDLETSVGTVYMQNVSNQKSFDNMINKL